ncbi:MAG: 50S ribosomal protein L25/general stress protein Ctc [Flavobacteriales bacterium]
METVKLSAQARVNLGKKESKALRAAGSVPCVIYGGEKNIHFSAQDNDLRNLVYTPNVYRVEVEIDGTTHTAILKDIQFHPVTDKVIHIDFMELVADKEITLNVPIRLEGSAKGVMNGGKLRKNMRQLTVRATPANLPDSITIDVTELAIGNSTRVSDLQGNDFDILNPSSAVIVAVKMARGAAADEEEEGEAEASPEAEAAE